MSDRQTDLAYQDVDDDLRQERLKQLWQRYGKYLIATAFSIVVIVAGREAYSAWVEARNADRAARYLAASEAALAEEWIAAAADLGGGYGALARLQAAASLAEAGDFDAAIAQYDAIAAATDADQVLRSYARLLSGMSLLRQGGDSVPAAIARLTPLAAQGQVFYYSATEQLAIAALENEDYDTARARLDQLLSDADTPAGMRQRVTAIQALLPPTQIDQAEIEQDQTETEPTPDATVIPEPTASSSGGEG